MTGFSLAIAAQTPTNGGGCYCNGGLLLCTGTVFAVFGGCTKAAAPTISPNIIATVFAFAAAAGTGAVVDVPVAASAFIIVGAYTDTVFVIVAVANRPTWIEASRSSR